VELRPSSALPVDIRTYVRYALGSSPETVEL
jgi:hypothetical protein